MSQFAALFAVVGSEFQIVGPSRRMRSPYQEEGRLRLPFPGSPRPSASEL
jgi:hypothetical protein